MATAQAVVAGPGHSSNEPMSVHGMHGVDSHHGHEQTSSHDKVLPAVHGESCPVCATNCDGHASESSGAHIGRNACPECSISSDRGAQSGERAGSLRVPVSVSREIPSSEPSGFDASPDTVPPVSVPATPPLSSLTVLRL